MQELQVVYIITSFLPLKMLKLIDYHYPITPLVRRQNLQHWSKKNGNGVDIPAVVRALVVRKECEDVIMNSIVSQEHLIKILY